MVLYCTLHKILLELPFCLLAFNLSRYSATLVLRAESNPMPRLHTSAAGHSAVTRRTVCPVGRTWTCACRLLWCMVVRWVLPRRSNPRSICGI